MVKYWSIALLLVCRLIVGELAHSMPHGEQTHEATTAAHCEQPGEANAPTLDDAPLDCCESGACDCPCAHVNCIASPHLVLDSQLESIRAIQAVAGLAHEQPLFLLRPPA